MINRPQCPRCEGLLVFKHGSYKLASGRYIQRWFCQRCRKGFSPNSTVQETLESISETAATHPKDEY